MPPDFEECGSSSVLMRLPMLCKFLASLSGPMLNHKLCDLAFCSYAWNDPAAERTQTQGASWSVFCVGGANRLADVVCDLARSNIIRFIYFGVLFSCFFLTNGKNIRDQVDKVAFRLKVKAWKVVWPWRRNKKLSL